MESFFTAEFFRENRRKLRALFTGKAPIVLTANGLLQRGGDSTYPFRQDSNFWYLTGIDAPDIVLVMDKEKEYLIMPDRAKTREVFDGTLSKQTLSIRSGIKTLVSEKEGWRQLSARLKKVKHVATVAAAKSYVDQHGFYANPARSKLIKTIKILNPEVEFLDLGRHFVRLRIIKQEPEIQAIRRATEITLKTLKQTSKNLAKYKYEYEVEAELTRAIRGQGAPGHAYQPIVASGLNACQLYYVNNSAIIGRGPLLIDAGAEVEHCCAAITRTYPAREFTKRQRDIYQAVEEVQQFALSHLKPGVLPKSYEQAVHHFMGEKLRELGLIKTISKDSVHKYYPHSTSHFLGLDVHDVGDYERPLEPGMVLTVEPGIYVPKEGIGIRIEDDVLITSSGIEV